MRWRVFHRTWWRDNPAYPDGLEPYAGRKHHITDVRTEEEARTACRVWNASHPAGRYLDKAEYEYLD